MTHLPDSPAFRATPPAPPMPLAEARARIVAAITPITDTETLDLADALHRVLAEAVVSSIDVPGAANSSMDGYGFASADVAGRGNSDSATLQVVGESLAGHPFTGTLAPGQCIRIMTGAVVPASVDSVVMQENTHVDGDRLIIDQVPEPGSNVRPAGEDLARGQTVLAAGSFLQPADIAVLASVGAARVKVIRRPRVAFFSSGDELRPIDGPIAPGEIYDSNRYGLAAQLTALGMDGVNLGVVGDSPAALGEAFEAAKGCDALITSGGVSVGAADFVVDVLKDKGAVDFWRVAIKPGKPLAFGTLEATRFFGLPGNPVSTAVTFLQLVRPALVRLAGGEPAAAIRFPMATRSELHKRPGREHFLRARMDFSSQPPQVVAVDHQGSGVMRSMSTADAFIVLPADSGDVAAGESVVVEPFAQTVWARPVPESSG